MAAITYKVGADANNITLAMQVGTAAGWTAKVFKPAGGGQWTTIARSKVVGVTVVFDPTVLGTAKDLRGLQPCIENIADFRPVPEVDGNTLMKDSGVLHNDLSIKYTLSGGQDGEQSFGYDDNDVTFSDTGEVVTVDKYINFI